MTTGDTSAITAAISEAIAENPKALEDYRNGKAGAFNFLVGQVMKKTRGKCRSRRAEQDAARSAQRRGGVKPVHLIVAEKNISARRIAEILSEGKKITERKDAGVSTYSYGDTMTMGLRGHVVEIDFRARIPELAECGVDTPQSYRCKDNQAADRAEDRLSSP